MKSITSSVVKNETVCLEPNKNQFKSNKIHVTANSIPTSEMIGSLLSFGNNEYKIVSCKCDLFIPSVHNTRFEKFAESC